MFGRKISFDRDDDFEKPKEKPFLTDEEFNNLFPTGHVPTSNVFPKESVIHCLTDESKISF